jgi:high affinity sulfate transporter 1
MTRAAAPTASAANRFRILAGLNGHNWGQEALAGITLAAIAVPLNIGYAQIAGLPPTAGLYALIVPAIIFAVLSSTRQLVASPDAAAAALVASSVGGLAAAGSASYLQLALAQALIAGVIFALCGIFKLGFLANFLSEPILIGFVGGLALDILTSQIAKMLGISVHSGEDFIPRLGELISGLSTTNIWSVLISVGSVAILVFGRRLLPRIPWALVVLIVMTVILIVAGLADAGVAVLGHVDAGPPKFTWPMISLTQWVQLIPSAGALALVTMAEGLLVARKYAEQHGYTVNPNRDLIAFGGANIASGLTGGFTVGSSASRTAAMDQSGSRTQLPSIVAAVITLLLVIFGTGLLADIPSPAIGAIVGVAVAPLLGIGEFVKLWRVRRFEFVVAAACFLGALLLGPIVGIVIAFVLSLINIARRAARPEVAVLTASDDPSYSLRADHAGGGMTADGVIVMRFAAPLFFANANVISEAIHRAVDVGLPQGLQHLVLDCEAITDIDVTAAGVLDQVIHWVESQQVTFSFSRVRAELKTQLLALDLLSTGAKVFDSNRVAVSALSRTR